VAEAAAETLVVLLMAVVAAAVGLIYRGYSRRLILAQLFP